MRRPFFLPNNGLISEDFLVLALREGPKISEDKHHHFVISVERVFRVLITSVRLSECSEAKNQPKEEVFSRTSLRTSGQKLTLEMLAKQACRHGHAAQTSTKKHNFSLKNFGLICRSLNRLPTQRAQWDICLPRGKSCRGTIFAPVLPLNYPHHEGILGTIWGTIYCTQIAYMQGLNHFMEQFEGQCRGQFRRG